MKNESIRNYWNFPNKYNTQPKITNQSKDLIKSPDSKSSRLHKDQPTVVLRLLLMTVLTKWSLHHPTSPRAYTRTWSPPPVTTQDVHVYSVVSSPSSDTHSRLTFPFRHVPTYGFPWIHVFERLTIHPKRPFSGHRNRRPFGTSTRRLRRDILHRLSDPGTLSGRPYPLWV